ncbi:3-hydroxybutyrate oligomer hydrolase family protein [Marinobacter salicampi]|uniref:3-hydroxybutyrate oligomer hydrolase family protein n=1 Tax=Marinobacter salicampi TaxID=435907 RepID=UPI00140E4228|nr:3-hydroxybutyrate oligomer hydrolase family protein [Marinobacter salicampi]
MTIRATLVASTGALFALTLTACKELPPPAFVDGEIHHARYADNNDLLTAGLGASGLASATAPAFADALNPTAEELRTLTIYNNYRALVDTAPGGGYGTFFGPQVNAGQPGGLVPGDEYLAFVKAGPNNLPVTVMVQIPDAFDRENACMVTAPSSGSRGVYGAIGTAGEWGLKKGCAVVYTDKGTGTGSNNLETNTAQLIDGRLTDDPNAAVQFRADLSEAERAAFTGQFPDRFAFKHAHSRANPEADWGEHVLQSIEFGFYILNRHFAEQRKGKGRAFPILPANTLVIASSVSNGGGASVRAAEQDKRHLIDGVAVSEPNVNPVVDTSFTIRQGDGPVITEHSRSLLDYTTALAVYQGCANRAPDVRGVLFFNDFFNNQAVNENACDALAVKGLVNGADLDARAADAQRILNEEFGVQPEQNLIAPTHFGLAVAQSISMTYANAYGEFGVEDRVCGLSLAASGAGGEVAPLPETQEAALFATSNGIPPTGGVNLIYDEASGVATNLAVSVSPSSGLQDYGLDALLCLRSLAQGSDAVTGEPLDSEAAEKADRVAQGIEEIRANGDLNRKPTVFVTGRSDAILPINHTSRPYFGLNQTVEGKRSSLHYYEVLNAHHLDTLNGLAGYNERFVPLHHYFFQALDLVYDNLRNGTELPPSQVVRTTPRGAGAPALTAANIPDISAVPAVEDQILFENNQVRIPD